MEKQSFNREFIRTLAKECGVEMPKEMENALVQRHLDSRDAFAEAQVKEYQNEHPENTVDVKASQEYKDLKKKFDDYVAEQTANAAKTAKESAFREVLKAAGIPEKRLATVLKVSDLDSVELDKDGKIKDVEKLTESIKTEWADFIPTTTQTGANTATPPDSNTAAKDPGEMTMPEYIKYRKGE